MWRLVSLLRELYTTLVSFVVMLILWNGDEDQSRCESQDANVSIEIWSNERESTVHLRTFAVKGFAVNTHSQLKVRLLIIIGSLQWFVISSLYSEIALTGNEGSSIASIHNRKSSTWSLTIGSIECETGICTYKSNLFSEIKIGRIWSEWKFRLSCSGFCRNQSHDLEIIRSSRLGKNRIRICNSKLKSHRKFLKDLESEFHRFAVGVIRNYNLLDSNQTSLLYVRLCNWFGVLDFQLLRIGVVQ